MTKITSLINSVIKMIIANSKTSYGQLALYNKCKKNSTKIPLNQKVVYFKAECDFTNRKDVADFFYSLDGKTWIPLGTQLKMVYTFPHFMGYRFALFNYATKNTGGAADFDFFHITGSITTL